MTCSKCGYVSSEGSNFCEKCGSKLEKADNRDANLIICSHCNTKYDGAFGVCPKCGAVSLDSNSSGISSVESSGLHCHECGLEVREEEKYCIRCGAMLQRNNDREEIAATNLQTELCNAFSGNKFLSFIAKYAIVFALYYPIYLLIGRVEALSGFENVLEYVSIIGFYGYYIGLIALYANRKYLPLLIALSLRFLNSAIVIFQSSNPISSIFRIVAIVCVFVFIFKKFSATGQYEEIRSNLNMETKKCVKCGATMKKGDLFCPKCGNRMGG